MQPAGCSFPNHDRVECKGRRGEGGLDLHWSVWDMMCFYVTIPITAGHDGSRVTRINKFKRIM